MLLRIALRNLLHRPGRSALTAAGVGLAAGTVLCLLSVRDGYRDSIEKSVDRLGAHLVVTAPGCPYEAATVLMRGGTGIRYIAADLADAVRADPRVEIVSPQLMHPAFAAGFDRLGEENAGITLLLGVDPAYFALRPWVRFRDGSFPRDPGAREVVLGSEASRVLRRRTGDPYLVPGTGESFRVAGVLEATGTQDDGAVLLPLRTLGTSSGLSGRLTAVAVRLRDPRDIDALADELQHLPDAQVIRLSQVREALVAMTSGAQWLMLVLGGLGAVVALFGVCNAVLASVLERSRLFAMLRAMGAAPRDIFGIIAIETTLLCFGGAVAGILLCVFAGPLFAALTARLLPFAPAAVSVRLAPAAAAAAVPACILLGLVSSVLPALRALRRPPLSALREDGT